MLALFLLCCLAIIMYALSGGNSSSLKNAEVPATQIEKTEVDISKASEIEPSTLTSALVDGKDAEKTVSDEDTEVAETEIKATEGEAKESTSEEATAKNASASEYLKEHGVDPALNQPAVVAAKEADSTTTEAETANTEASAKNLSASEYLKEHGVDPALNQPAVVAAKEAVSTTTGSETVNTEAQTAVASHTELNAEEMLLMAREAYWNNGLEESAEIYQTLIGSKPDVIEYKGELGNVYWRQGFPKKAAFVSI